MEGKPVVGTLKFRRSDRTVDILRFHREQQAEVVGHHSGYVFTTLIGTHQPRQYSPSSGSRENRLERP